MKLYTSPYSGYSHRVELLLGFLDLRFERTVVDLRRGEQRQLEFLKLNPWGQVPVLVEDAGLILAESNAILIYLAATYGVGRWLPPDAPTLARLQAWLSRASGPLSYGPAAARASVKFRAPGDLSAAQAEGARLLAQTEKHLQSSRFLLGEEASLADIAMYGYTAAAPEGGIDLRPFHSVRRWLGEIESLPKFVPFNDTALQGKLFEQR